MIGYLKGKVLSLTSEGVLLEVNGVGYEVICSGAAFSRLSASDYGEVYTFLQVKEDGIALFGFADQREKELFLRLTSVSGVGAKLAISILSAMRPEELSDVIAAADAKRLSSVKGVGKKTADRIILELHGKISADALIGAGEGILRAEIVSREEEEIASLSRIPLMRRWNPDFGEIGERGSPCVIEFSH